MAPTKFVSALLLCSFIGCEKAPTPSSRPAEVATEEAVSPTADSWPLARGDSLATGVAKSRLPERLELLWTFSTDKGGFDAAATIVEGMVYVGSTDGNLYAVNLANGKKRWAMPSEAKFNTAPAVAGGRVFIGDSDGRFYGVDARSGKAKWTFPTEREIYSSANLYRDCVLFGSSDFFIYCLKAKTGELVWKYETGDEVRSFPVVSGDRAYAACCDGKLHVLDLRQGKGTAQIDLDWPSGAAAAMMNGVVFLGTEGNEFLAVDPQRRRVLWRYQNLANPSPFWSSAAVTPGAVVVGSQDKLVHALDPKTGRPLWSFPTKGFVDGSPVVVGERLFVGSADGRLYELDLKSGRELWRFSAGGRIIASPAVAAGRLVIGTEDGNLYCFGGKR